MFTSGARATSLDCQYLRGCAQQHISCLIIKFYKLIICMYFICWELTLSAMDIHFIGSLRTTSLSLLVRATKIVIYFLIYLLLCVLIFHPSTRLLRGYVVVIGWSVEEPVGARTSSSAPV